MKETELLQGRLEPTNEPYAIAKIAGIKLWRALIDNLVVKKLISDRNANKFYGIGDNYHPKNSHVIPSLIRKIHLAKTKISEKLKFGDLVMFIENFYLVDDLAKCCI